MKLVSEPMFCRKTEYFTQQNFTSKTYTFISLSTKGSSFSFLCYAFFIVSNIETKQAMYVYCNKCVTYLLELS